jgi:hypothetical protein
MPERVARTLSEDINWVPHTSGLRVVVLVSLFPVLIRLICPLAPRTESYDTKIS